MQKNVGGYERPARLVVGALLVLIGAAGYAGMVPLAFTGIGQALTAVIAVLLGLILLATGWLQWCPISQVIGFSSHRGGNAGEDETTAERTS